LLLCLVLSVVASSSARPAHPQRTAATQKDTDASNNTAKSIFEKYDAKLTKTESSPDRTLIVYYVEFAWDPQTGPNARRLARLEDELYSAGAKKDFAIHDELDRIRIEVRWDQEKKTLREKVVPLP
jgi:hypothetical protein